MPLNISIQWNAGIACVSECVLKTLACRGFACRPVYKVQSRRDAPKLAILEAPCSQNAPGMGVLQAVFSSEELDFYKPRKRQLCLSNVPLPKPQLNRTGSVFCTHKIAALQKALSKPKKNNGMNAIRNVGVLQV